MASISDQLYIEAWERQQGLCAVCGEKLIDSAYEAHHLLPKNLGGEDTVDNIAIVCDREEHLDVHGGDFRAPIATTPEDYPYFYGDTKALDHAETKIEKGVEDEAELSPSDEDLTIDSYDESGGL